jgi:hypothetical protein
MEAVNSSETLATFCRGKYSSLSFCGYYDLLYFTLPKFQVERRCVLWLLYSRKKIEVLYKLRTYNNKTAAPPNTANRKIKSFNADKPYEDLTSSCCKSKHTASETVSRKAGLKKRIAG